RIATQSASTVAPRPPLVAGVVQQKPPQPPPQQQHQPQQLPQASSSASAGSPIKAAPPLPTATAAAAAAADAALIKPTVRQRPRPSQAQQQQQKQTLKQPWVTLEPQQQTSSSAAASATAAAAAPTQPSAGNRSSSLFDIRVSEFAPATGWVGLGDSQQAAGISAAATAAAAAAAAPASSQAGSLDRLRHASQQQQQPPPSIAGWNPFATDDDQHQPETAVGRGASVGTSGAAADGNSSEDALEDAMFGLEFDRIRRAGSQSSMAAQKSREDLVMEEPDPAFDPFGAAPINPKLKSKHSSGSGGNSASADRSKKLRRSKREQTRARRGEQHHQLHHHHHRADVDWLCAGSDDETACGLDRSGRSDLFAAIPFRKDPDDKSRYEQLDHCYSDEEVLQQSSIANFNFIASDNDNTGSKQLPRQVDCGSAAPAATVVDPVAVPDHQLGAGRHRLRLPSRETSSDGLDEYGTDGGGGGGGGCG
uniref:PDZ domain-containing protein n=1 Tax=Macrostomum lignano TaxID=282301 RepID=A0A1I8G4P4_9PLAT